MTRRVGYAAFLFEAKPQNGYKWASTKDNRDGGGSFSSHFGRKLTLKPKCAGVPPPSQATVFMSVTLMARSITTCCMGGASNKAQVFRH